MFLYVDKNMQIKSINRNSVNGVLMNAPLQDGNHSLCLSDLSLISTDSELRENINNVSVSSRNVFM